MAIQKFTITQHDGSEVTVTPNLGDTLNFERTLKQNPKWGSLQENALKMQPFRAWSAGRREGTITATWEDFTTGPEAAIDVSPADEADEADDLEVPGWGLGTTTEQPTT